VSDAFLHESPTLALQVAILKFKGVIKE
jgi:hypothetical protein